jgi:stage III sporulation protein AG
VKKGEGIKKFADYLRAHPWLELGFYLVLAGLAVALFLMSGNSEQKEAKGEAAKQVSMQGDSMEEKLAYTLSAIKGVGDVRVLISYATSEEIVPAMSVDEQNSGSSLSRSEEPVTVGKGGDEQAMVLMVRSPTVRGAIIIAEGAEDVSVRMDLLRAAQAILDVPSSNIEVFPMGSGEGG